LGGFFQGILENLEEQIREHFICNPGKQFVASNLSSYERLLAHVCSTYNQLDSQSNSKSTHYFFKNRRFSKKKKNQKKDLKQNLIFLCKKPSASNFGPTCKKNDQTDSNNVIFTRELEEL
jgi:hypothetical protein